MLTEAACASRLYCLYLPMFALVDLPFHVSSMVLRTSVLMPNFPRRMVATLMSMQSSHTLQHMQDVVLAFRHRLIVFRLSDLPARARVPPYLFSCMCFADHDTISPRTAYCVWFDGCCHRRLTLQHQ